MKSKQLLRYLMNFFGLKLNRLKTFFIFAPDIIETELYDQLKFNA